jgi:UPF0755 protein
VAGSGLTTSPRVLIPLVTALAGVLILAWVLWLARSFFGPSTPLAPAGQEIVFRINAGESLRAVSRRLQGDGFLPSARGFESLAKDAGKAQSIRAGEFLLVTGWSAERILEELTTSPGLLSRVQVREGLTWWETAQAVAASGAAKADEFRAAVFDPALLEREHIPGDSPEGFLFPETYLVTKSATDNGRVLAEAMFKEFWKNARKVWPDQVPAPAELLRVVTLASLVEKESGDLSERARIAGVFVNRLRLGMRLQSDPTTIYGLGPDFDGDLKRAHLEDGANPYNTYRLAGLPPGPICSPGLVSLQAAANPETHDYLYFVAKGDGTHFFSKSLEEHNQAVYKFQKLRNKETYRSTVN